MTELQIGMLSDVVLDLLPVVAVGADMLAIAADREKAVQLFDVRERLFEFSDPISERGSQPQDPQADVDPGPEDLRVERLAEEVIGP